MGHMIKDDGSLGVTLAALALVFAPFMEMMASGDGGNYYSHIPLIPLITGGLFYLKKKEIFGKPSSFHPGGAAAAFIGVAIY